jgi:nitrite reductase/ring-hydroxylating ferredoxin subunit
MRPVISRREWMRQSTRLIGCSCLCHTLLAGSKTQSTCCSTPEVEPASLLIEDQRLIIDLSLAASLQPVGGAANIIHKEKSLDIIVVHYQKRKYAALSGLCTHAFRPLSYVHTRGLLQCNNYGHSLFDLKGQVVKGPAPTALKSYAVVFLKGKLEIILY